MVIRSSQPDPSRRIPTPGTDATPAPPALQRELGTTETTPSATGTPKDRAEVSSAAQELFESSASSPVSSSSLPADRMRSILERVRSGHYDRPEVLDQVAQKFRAEVEGPRKDD